MAIAATSQLEINEVFSVHIYVVVAWMLTLYHPTHSPLMSKYICSKIIWTCPEVFKAAHICTEGLYSYIDLMIVALWY